MGAFEPRTAYKFSSGQGEMVGQMIDVDSVDVCFLPPESRGCPDALPLMSVTVQSAVKAWTLGLMLPC